MSIHSVLLKLHLWVALTVGLFVLLLGATGALLVFGPAYDRMMSPELRQVTPQETRMSLQELVDRSRAAGTPNLVVLPGSRRRVGAGLRADRGGRLGGLPQSVLGCDPRRSLGRRAAEEPESHGQAVPQEPGAGRAGRPVRRDRDDSDGLHGPVGPRALVATENRPTEDVRVMAAHQLRPAQPGRAVSRPPCSWFCR